MQEWFYFETITGAQRVKHIERIENVESVRAYGSGIIIYFKHNGDAVVTDTYDLMGFVANVLEDAALQSTLDGSRE